MKGGYRVKGDQRGTNEVVTDKGECAVDRGGGCKAKSDCVNSRHYIIVGSTSGADDDAEEENQKRRDYTEGTNVFWTFH